ncbi:MAG: hypothetical protein K2I89_06385 [Muribaculaceae bacterium]|nr:hypothetical protein [Muribaculaceae bacterium]
MKKTLLSLIIASGLTSAIYASDRWSVLPDSSVISMSVTKDRLPHADHVEMSGKKMAVVLYWDLDSSSVFGLNRARVFPMLRTIPNDTHASLMLNNDIDIASMLRINGRKVSPITKSVELNGMMKVVSDYTTPDGSSVELSRTIFPTMEHPAMIELYTAHNNGDKNVTLIVPELKQTYTTDAAKGVDGAYVIQSDVNGAGAITLQPGETADFSLIIQAYKANGGTPLELNATEELAERLAFIDIIDNNLILNTPDKAIDTEFRYAKIRGAESIYKTKGGYMHGPGGESYYAALWCNDQAEYINPFFPFLGYDVGNESALNCFRHYARFINDEYKPIPSSIIAEGDDIWNGAGDRGDAAMLAYGASRYVLAHGDKVESEELWTLIEWCLEYCRRKLNEEGVVLSDHDELEGRFPAGNANLCTASLYYDALVSAVYLGKELGKPSKQLASYSRQAKELRKAIESYFGANVQGFDTYRYYDGNDVLRSWICIPLVMGIDERADQTVKALFSPEMYTEDGVLTCQGYPVFWDRATLYTLRGALHAGYPDEVIPRLSDFSRRRLLGEHVPYPVEAWPEGSQRHLSAESGLYCRVITEGLFGIRPTGFKRFELKPELPTDWNFAELKHIRAFGTDFDINITRISPERLKVTITDHNGKFQHFTVKSGNKINISL